MQAMQHGAVAWLAPLLLACLLLLVFPTALGQDGQPPSSAKGDAESPECLAAVMAQQLALNTGAALKNMTELPFPDNDEVVPDADLLARVLEAATRLKQTPSNLVSMFQGGTPYGGWGNLLVQIAFSQSLHVPSAVLGEMTYACRTTEGAYHQAKAAATARNESVPQNSTFTFWKDSWSAISRALLEGAPEVDDPISKRAMLLRSLNYIYTSYYPLPTSPEYLEVYTNASKTFKEAMHMFDAYQTNFFKVSFDNGTATADLDAFLVTPSPNTAMPTIVFLGSIYNWKEVQFMRYGLAALRRNYAVVFMDQPGQGFALRRPPYMPSTPNTEDVVASLLDTVKANEDLKGKVDQEQVALVGIGIGSYGSGRACSLLGDRLAACVLNPAIVSLGDLAVDVVANRVYGPAMSVAQDDTAAFPTPEVGQAFILPRERILKALLHECSGSAQATKLLGATLQGTTDPELLYPPLTMLGLVNSTAEELTSHYWHAFDRLLEEFGPVHDLEGWGTWKAPVLILSGEEDRMTGGQEEEMKEVIEKAGGDAKLVSFPSYTGAALGVQVGGNTWWELTVFPWLAEVMAESASDNGKVEEAGRRRS